MALGDKSITYIMKNSSNQVDKFGYLDETLATL